MKIYMKIYIFLVANRLIFYQLILDNLYEDKKNASLYSFLWVYFVASEIVKLLI